MVNSSTVSTCPLFPELEGTVTVSNGRNVFTLSQGAVLPQGVGSGTVSASYDVSYDVDAWNSTALRNYKFELHEKYPALQQAWDHYQNVLKMCRSREEEINENRS